MLLSEIELIEDEYLIGDAEFDVLGYLDDHPGKRMLSWLGNVKFSRQTANSIISGIITKKEYVDYIDGHIGGFIVSEYPDRTFWRIHDFVFEKCNSNKKTRIGNNCKISPLAYIADNNVIIGNNVVIDEFTSINEYSLIGDNVIIHSHCVVGAELDQLSVDMDGTQRTARHYGGVEILESSFIQSKALIARSVYYGTRTIIGKKSIVGADAFIAHGCHIGNNVVILGQAQVAGSTTIKDGSEIGACAFVGNKLIVGEKSVVTSKSKLVKNLPSNSAYWNGNIYSREKYDAIRKMAALQKKD